MTRTYLVELERYPLPSLIATFTATSRDDAWEQARSYCTHVIPDTPVCISYIVREGTNYSVNCSAAQTYRKYIYGGCQ